MTAKTPTPWAATAAGVRRELKARRAELGIPASASIKVTSESFSGGASVDVEIDGADGWAWRTATEADAGGAVDVGDRVLTAQVRTVGERIEEIIRNVRTQVGAGYIWGGVTYRGTTVGSLAREGFVPGQD